MNDKEIVFKYLILWTVYISFAVLFWPFKTALLLAALFAMAMTPLLNRWLNKVDREKLLIFFMVAGLILIIIVPLTLIVTKGILNLANLQQDAIAQSPLYKNIEVTVGKLWGFVNNLSTRFNFDLNESFDVQSILPKALQFVLPWLTALVTKLPEFLLQLFVFVTTLYFFLVKRREFLSWFKERRILSEDSLARLIALLQKVSYTVVFSTIIVASVQATIVTLGASISGFDGLLIIFILTFFMSFIPVVGSVPVSAALALFCFIQGDSGHGIVMLIALGIAGGIDNVIRAYILSAQEEIHPLISLLTLIGALAVFGISGLFLGPIIAELAFAIGSIMKGEPKGALPQVVASDTESKPQHSP
ncbi:MAG: AI-2E family transporter [Bdellovibrionota bacterium]